MAAVNPDRPNGFTPVKSLSGRPWNGTFRTYTRADTSALTTNNHGDIHVGDAVSISASTGLVSPLITNVACLGVVVAIGAAAMHGEPTFADPANQTQKTHSELTNTTDLIGVVLANDMLFSVQTALSLTLVPSETADVNVSANTVNHGSRTTGQSNMELTTNSNADVKVVETPNDADGNDPTLTNARHLVMFMNKEFTNE